MLALLRLFGFALFYKDQVKLLKRRKLVTLVTHGIPSSSLETLWHPWYPLGIH